MFRNRRILRMLGACMIAVMVLSGITVFMTDGSNAVYAKEKGHKNQQARDACESVREGTPPAGYSSISGAGATSVYRGGQSESGLQGATRLDTDPNNFANPLPYGDTYVDTSRLKWRDGDDFIIEIKDPRFKWVAFDGAPAEDSRGNKPTSDPMGLGKGVGWTEAVSSVIAYVGELEGFHENFTDPASTDGTVNEIEASGDYLYRVTYPNAVILPSGVRGNLVVTVKKVVIETAFTVDSDHPRVLTAQDGTTYSYDKAIVAVQGANNMYCSTGMTDSEGNYIVQNCGLVKTAADVRAQLEAARTAGSTISDNTMEGASQDKYSRGATGVQTDLDITVTDADGNLVNGTISYAAKDLDIPSWQNTWGRGGTGNERLKFAEGIEIVSGSLSYALTPVYNGHQGESMDEGWVPVGPFDADLDSPLNVVGGNGTHADGTIFRSTGMTHSRDQNGTWEKSLFSLPSTAESEQIIITFPGAAPHAGGGRLVRPYTDMTPSYAVRQQLMGKVRDPETGELVTNSNDVTAEMVRNYLGDTSWVTERNDGNTFDSGFAVLLKASGSKLRWSGSSQSQGTAGTTLFDTTIFSYVEQSHGTGGGIYLESYDVSGDYGIEMCEGTVTMGNSSETTLTAVPEDGHRVSRILVGDTNFGKGSDKPALNDKTEYVIDGNDIKVNGVVVGTFGGDESIKGFSDLKTGTVEVEGFFYDRNGNRQTEGKLVFERNRDGSVDITLPRLDNPMHVHVDFSADYYFYKVWKAVSADKTPTKLNLTAAPYAFVPSDVTIDGTKYTIHGREFSADGKTYELDQHESVTIGNENYKLEGNALVTEEGVSYPINLKYGKVREEEEQSFTVTRDDARNPEEPNVVELEPDAADNPSPGDYVWKIKYPAEGYTTKAGEIWPELPTEVEPDSHAYSHEERNYWFVMEEAPGWSLFKYINDSAKAPGVVSDSDYDSSFWYGAAIKDYERAKRTIKATENMAYMSVFSSNNDQDDTWGGIITNVPGLIVKATKIWTDQNDRFLNRSGDIWLHIDRVTGDTVIRDILPAQNISPDAGGAELTRTWGDKKDYDTGDAKKKVVGEMDELPAATADGTTITYERNANGSYTGSNGVTYWLNELSAFDENGNEITYELRETDADGTEVNRDDPSRTLLGYKTIIDEWKDFVKSTTTVDQTPVDTYSANVENRMVVKDITVTKKWIGAAPQDVTLTLYNNTATTDVPQAIDTVTVSKDDFTAAGVSTKAYTFKDVPAYIEGKPADYTIKEEPEGDTWSAAVEGSYDAGSFTVTNTNDEPVVISVTKSWNDADDQDGARPDKITYELKADGKTVATEEVRVAADGKADYTFEKDKDGNALRKYNAASGEEINYEVTEKEIPAAEGRATGYTASVTGSAGSGFTVVNTHIPETVKLVLEKKWLDDSADGRPESIDVEVKADGTPIEGSPITLSADSGWTWTSGDLPRYKDGKEIEYTAEETAPEGYVHDDSENTIRRLDNAITITVVNTALIEVQGNKTWVGEDSKYGIRPQSLDIQLMQTIKEETSPVPDAVVTTDGEKNWAYTFGGLPAYTEDGYKITYSVGEVAVPAGYKQTVNGMNLVNTLIDPPVGEDRETYGKKGDQQFQDAVEMFTKGSGELTRYELIDPQTGEPTDKPVPAYDENGNQVGSYTIDSSGKITFTPDPEYVGTPTPATVRATDENGLWAEALYTPHIKDTTRTVRRTIIWVYNDKDSTPVREKAVQEATFIGEVDPKTGEIISWGDPQTMVSIENPKVKGWTPDIEVPEWTGTPDNPPKDIKVVYSPQKQEQKPAAPTGGDRTHGSGGSGTASSTGDGMSFAFPGILLIAAGCGIAAILYRRRKESDNQ